MDSSPDEARLCSLVARLNHRLDGHIRRVADGLGITSSQAIALRELDGPMTLKELAVRMSCEASNAGYVIDRMEEQKLVRRQPHESDRRSKNLILTEAGETCRGNVLEALSRNAPVDALSDTEKKALATLLEKAAE